MTQTVKIFAERNVTVLREAAKAIVELGQDDVVHSVEVDDSGAIVSVTIWNRAPLADGEEWSRELVESQKRTVVVGEQSEPETVAYVVAGVATVDGEKKVVSSIVDVPASLDAFSRDLRALDALPAECLKYGGRNAAQAWPLESPQGTALALKLGLAKPAPALDEPVDEPVRAGDFFEAGATDKRGEVGIVVDVDAEGVVLRFLDGSKRRLFAGDLRDTPAPRTLEELATVMYGDMSLAEKLVVSHAATTALSAELDRNSEAIAETLSEAALVACHEFEGFDVTPVACETCSSPESGTYCPLGTHSETPSTGCKGGAASRLLVEPSSVKPRRSLGGSYVSKVAAGSYRYTWGGVTFSIRKEGVSLWAVDVRGAEDVFVDTFKSKRDAVEFLNGYAMEYATALSRDFWKHDDEKRIAAGVVEGATVEVHYRGRDYVGRVTEVVRSGLNPVRVGVVFNIGNGAERFRLPVWRGVRVVDESR